VNDDRGNLNVGQAQAVSRGRCKAQSGKGDLKSGKQKQVETSNTRKPPLMQLQCNNELKLFMCGASNVPNCLRFREM
jgi:hypothetical protein